MPPAYLLDTNVVSYFVRGTSAAVRDRLLRTPIESMSVSAVTEAELLYWVARRPADARTSVSVRDFLGRVASLPWDLEPPRSMRLRARSRDALAARCPQRT